jgi:aspartate/methionine/tyrosine aminotransferase
VSIYSSGKTFSATGYKIGWACGPSSLISRLQTLHQFSVFSVASTLQLAVASALDAAVKPYKGFDSYYSWLAAMYKSKRDFFLDTLHGIPGLASIIPDGAFFIMARHADADSDVSGSRIPPAFADFVQSGTLAIDPLTANRPDYNYCRKLAVDKSVVAIPPSAFYCEKDAGQDLARNFVRFSFSKKIEVLETARTRLLL